MICYNCMASIAKYSLDLSDNEYIPHGVRRKNLNQLNPSELVDGDIIFVKTDFIVNGLFSRDFLHKISKKFVLITGTSDYSLDVNNHFKSILDNPNLIHWFACNPPSEDFEKISFLPIGFQEYERLGDNLELLKSNINNDISWDDKLDKIYIPYHSLTNQSRQSVINELSHYSFVEIEKIKLSFEDYLDKIKQYKFVLSLRGNGWDCHRNYEILYSGSIPVMQEGPISKSFHIEGIPHITLSDINNEIFNKKFTIDKNILFLNYWESKIKDKISQSE